ncbi:MAG TPA: TetR/AcrR family transcriptional regulator [Stellaceae bacterium]|nr:TetR/AcrR family transcriptional regulator [Stellaceae bacterium]
MQAKKRAGRKKPPAAPPPGDLSPRARILYAAFESFMEVGYAKTSMLAIATRARVSKRDLYANFADKGAILAACIEGRARDMRAPLELPPPQTEAALAATLERFGKSSLGMGTLATSVAAFRLAIAEPDTDAAAVLDRSARVSNRAVLDEFFASAQKNGLLGPGDPRVMAGRFLTLLWGDVMMRLLLRIAPAPDEREIERRAREATRILLALHGPGAGASVAAPDGQPPRTPR